MLHSARSACTHAPTPPLFSAQAELVFDITALLSEPAWRPCQLLSVCQKQSYHESSRDLPIASAPPSDNPQTPLLFVDPQQNTMQSSLSVYHIDLVIHQAGLHAHLSQTMLSSLLRQTSSLCKALQVPVLSQLAVLSRRCRRQNPSSSAVYQSVSESAVHFVSPASAHQCPEY